MANYTRPRRVKFPGYVFGIRNERLKRRPVEAFMDRVKVTLVALLPALWLIASGERLLGSCGHCSTPTTSVTKHAFENDKGCPSTGYGSVDLSARRVNSRISSQPGKVAFFFLDSTARSESLRAQSLANIHPCREGPIALAARWQFDSRAAPEPRAPTSVS